MAAQKLGRAWPDERAAGATEWTIGVGQHGLIERAAPNVYFANPAALKDPNAAIARAVAVW